MTLRLLGRRLQADALDRPFDAASGPFFAAELSPTRTECAAAAAIVVALALCWFVATAISHRSGPWDNVEQLVWTQALQWGYYKHPPLPTWMLTAATLAFGPGIQTTWALGVTCVAIGLWLTWRLGCDLIGVRRATVGLLLSSTIAYYSVRALYYNHNVAMLPFVAAAALLLHRALRDGRLRQWVGFGIAAGLGALCKYQIVVFVVCWGWAAMSSMRARPDLSIRPDLSALANKQHLSDEDASMNERVPPDMHTSARRPVRPPSDAGRRASRGAGLAAAVIAASVVVAPHLLWLIQNDFLPFQYADRQLERLSGVQAWLGNMVSFAAAQFSRAAPIILAMGLCVWRLSRHSRATGRRTMPNGPIARWIDRAFGGSRADESMHAAPPSQAAWRFLLLVGLGPLALTWAIGLADVHLEGHWGTPELLALGLVLGARWPAAGSLRTLAALAGVVAALQLVMASGFALGRGLVPHLTGTIARSTYPASDVAEAIAAQWHARTDAPLALVAGETWEAGAVALNVSPRARVLIDGDAGKSPGVTADSIARCGAMVVWDTSRETDLPASVVQLRQAGEAFGTAKVRWSDSARARPVVLGWAMIPPPAAGCR